MRSRISTAGGIAIATGRTGTEAFRPSTAFVNAGSHTAKRWFAGLLRIRKSRSQMTSVLLELGLNLQKRAQQMSCHSRRWTAGAQFRAQGLVAPEPFPAVGEVGLDLAHKLLQHCPIGSPPCPPGARQ